MSKGRGLYIVFEQQAEERQALVLALNMEGRPRLWAWRKLETPDGRKGINTGLLCHMSEPLAFRAKALTLAEPVSVSWEFRVFWVHVINSWAWTQHSLVFHAQERLSARLWLSHFDFNGLVIAFTLPLSFPRVKRASLQPFHPIVFTVMIAPTL